jgi:hypothetical protein
MEKSFQFSWFQLKRAQAEFAFHDGHIRAGVVLVIADWTDERHAAFDP